MIRSSAVTIDEICATLDGVSHEERLVSLRTLDRSDQRLLFERAHAAPKLGADHYVPSDRLSRLSVRHYGRNTLPLPSKHRHFEKRFCRPEDGSSRLFGYNESPSRVIIGPGYFVAYSTAGRLDWESRGSFVIDYYQVPDGPVADGWPPVRENRQGLQRLVYYGTRDFMRRVSAHVSIGAAYKGDRPLDHYFVLCREP